MSCSKYPRMPGPSLVLQRRRMRHKGSCKTPLMIQPRQAVCTESELPPRTAGAARAIAGFAFEPESPILMLQLDAAGAQRLSSWSEQHIGGLLALSIAGQALTVVRVETALKDRLSCRSGR